MPLQKYQHEVQVSSRAPGVVYVRINNNRILFDSILEPFLRDYPQTDQLAHMLDHPDET